MPPNLCRLARILLELDLADERRQGRLMAPALAVCSATHPR